MGSMSVLIDVLLSIWKYVLLGQPDFPQRLLHDNHEAVATPGTCIQVDLLPFFNVKAAATGPNDPFADFDGSSRAYPAEWLPTESSFVYDGMEVSDP